MKIEKIFAVPHFHFDVEWWKTYDGYARDAINIIREAIRLLEKYPSFRFVIDQFLSLKPALEDRELGGKILRYIKDGRIEVVGGTLGAPDENLPHGESLIRQFVYGKKMLSEIGISCRCGWMIDEFGHTPQLPQILAKCGMGYVVFARGISPFKKHPVDFYWEAPDGSRVLTHWLCTGYTGMLPISPLRELRFRDWEREMNFCLGFKGERSKKFLLYPFGSDFSIPSEDWIGFVEKWNSEHPIKIEFSLPSSYFSSIQNIPYEKRSGSFDYHFTGCYESREKIKKYARKLQHSILSAESFGSIAYLLGGRYPELREAWEHILMNDFHDIICGTGTDEVYRRTVKRYKRAEKMINEALSSSLSFIASKINTQGSGMPLIIFNPLPWERKEPVISEVNGRFSIIDSSGKKIPSQISGKRILWMAEVPPLGYSTYFMVSEEEEEEKKEEKNLKAGKDFIENEFHLVKMEDGKIKIVDKVIGKIATIRIVAEKDIGNLWTIQKLQRIKLDSFSVKTEEGPVRASILAKMENGWIEIEKRISLYSQLRGIFFEYSINFSGRDCRVKVCFSPEREGKAISEVPFYVLQRGNGNWAVQNWLDYSSTSGFAIVNRGIPGYEIVGKNLYLTLFRSISLFPPLLLPFIAKNLGSIIKNLVYVGLLFSRGFQFVEDVLKYHLLILREYSSRGGLQLPGGINIADHLIPYLLPFRKSDSMEHGKHEFSFLVYPHQGDWKTANLPRIGMEFNTPLIPIRAEQHDGKFPKKKSFFWIEPENIMMLMVKKEEKGNNLVARIYESHGRGSEFILHSFLPLSMEKISATEDEIYEKIEGKEEGKGKIGRWEICTLRLKLQKI